MTFPLTTIGRGDGSGIAEPRRTIIRDRVEWRVLWAAHAGPESEAPVVDFGSHIVAAAFAGERPTAGFQIEIAAVRREGSVQTLVVTERKPPAGMMAAQMIVTPFHIVALPRHDGDVRFASPSDSDPAQPSAIDGAAADVPSSTGLRPNVAAALAYLAGPFSGILILLVERTGARVVVSDPAAVAEGIYGDVLAVRASGVCVADRVGCVPLQGWQRPRVEDADRGPVCQAARRESLTGGRPTPTCGAGRQKARPSRTS
jgi:hypothetical protein